MSTWLPSESDAAAPADQSADRVLETVQEIRQVGNAKVDGRRVRLRGVVTSSEKQWKQTRYLQDETGGILFFSTTPLEIQTGEYLEVEGVANHGDFAAMVVATSIKHLGFAEFPPPKHAEIDELMTGGMEGNRVEIDGWVRSTWMISNALFGANLASGTGRISVRVSDAEALADKDLVGAKVRIAGVAIAVRTDEARQHLVEMRVAAANPRDFQVLVPAPAGPAENAVTPVRDFLRYEGKVSSGKRVRVRGTILACDEQFTFVHDGKNGIAVRTIGPLRFAPGAVVDAVGFAELERSLPVLADAVVSGFSGALPPPKPVRSMDNLRRVDCHGSYVSITGKLMDRMTQALNASDPGPAPGGQLLLLSLGTQTGVLLAECNCGKETSAAARLEPGATLEVAGVAEVQTDMAGRPSGAKLLVPSLDQIRIVRSAPFWNARRLLVTTSLLLTVLLGGALRVAFLSRRAAELTRRNAKLEADLRERRAVAAERARLAEELHDSLQQTLTRVDLHPEVIVRERNPESTVAMDSARVARQLLDLCHRDLRAAVWDLKEIDRMEDLRESLRATVERASALSLVQFRFDAEGGAAMLSRETTKNLVSLATEAMTNVVKHSGAPTADVLLRVHPDYLELEIADQGNGFALADAASQEEGHFGLAHLNERCKRMNAELKIESAPESGCRIRVKVAKEEAEETAR